MNWLPGQNDREMEEEIRFHLEMEAEKNRRAGLNDADAMRVARRSFGGVRRVQEELRDFRRTRSFELFVRDVTYGLRTLRNARAYAVATIVTLSVAVGICAAMMTFAEGALLRPLPYRDVERVVTLWEANLSSGEKQLAVSPANFLDWQARATAFESMALSANHGVDVRRGDRVVAAPAGRVSADYFSTLGVTPIAGRFFERQDYDPSAEPRVVLARQYWLDAFDGDRALIGRTIEVDGKPTVILGIAPDRIDHAADYDVYLPLTLYGGEKTSRTGQWMYAAARMRPGVTLTQVQQDLDRVAIILGREHPQTNEALRVHVIPMRETILGRTRRLLTVLGSGSACLLLLACANIAALSLARGAARRRELAIRVSLGASTGRVVRQLVTESAILNLSAAVLGFAIALAVIRWMAANAPADLRRLQDVRAGAFTIVVLLVTTLVSTFFSGVLPAMRLARSGLAKDLESSRRDSGVTRSETRLQSMLVVAQIALALLLLAGGSLLTRSLQRLTANDLGFAPNGVATIQMYLYDVHPNPVERVAFIRSSLDAMRAFPGVVGAAATTAMPFDPASDARDDFELIGRPRRPGESLTLKTTAVTPGYFDTMRIQLVTGRRFEETDGAKSQLVAIVNEAAARRFWSDSPLGARVRIGVMGRPREWTIVGVARDTRNSDYAQEPLPEIFVPLAQGGSHVGGVNYVVRTTESPRQLLEAMQKKIWELTPSQSIASAELMTRLVARSLQTRRFALLMIAGFGFVALLLASTGLLGLLSYIAARRRSEVGVRMALGATPRHIERLFVRRGVSLAAAGIAVGVVLSLAFSRLLESYLYQTSAFDAGAIGAVTVATAAVALVISWIPARRIASLDPGTILRAP